MARVWRGMHICIAISLPIFHTALQPLSIIHFQLYFTLYIWGLFFWAHGSVSLFDVIIISILRLCTFKVKVYYPVLNYNLPGNLMHLEAEYFSILISKVSCVNHETRLNVSFFDGNKIHKLLLDHSITFVLYSVVYTFEQRGPPIPK